MKNVLLLSVFFLFSPVYMHAQKIKAYKIAELENRISNSDSVLVINFWATWCAPCVEELPYFHSIVNKYKNDRVKLLLVSLDFKEAYPKKISAFANKKKYNAEIVWLNETNADEFCPGIDSSWSGSIPATLIINPRNNYHWFFEGKLTPDKLEEAIRHAF